MHLCGVYVCACACVLDLEGGLVKKVCWELGLVL